jgi:hypothetical protein
MVIFFARNTKLLNIEYIHGNEIFLIESLFMQKLSIHLINYNIKINF